MILLATDNQDASSTGRQLFTVREGAERALGLGVMIVALDANTGNEIGAEAAQDLAAAAALTGGSTYPAGDGAAAVDQISAIVTSLPSTTIEGPVVTSSFDVPGRALGALLPLGLVLLVTWRVVRP